MKTFNLELTDRETAENIIALSRWYLLEWTLLTTLADAHFQMADIRTCMTAGVN